MARTKTKPGPKPRAPEETLTEQKFCRLTKAEAELAEAAAAAEGRKLSNWIRTVVLRALPVRR